MFSREIDSDDEYDDLYQRYDDTKLFKNDNMYLILEKKKQTKIKIYKKKTIKYMFSKKNSRAKSYERLKTITEYQNTVDTYQNYKEVQITNLLNKKEYFLSKYRRFLQDHDEKSSQGMGMGIRIAELVKFFCNVILSQFNVIIFGKTILSLVSNIYSRNINIKFKNESKREKFIILMKNIFTDYWHICYKKSKNKYQIKYYFYFESIELKFNLFLQNEDMQNPFIQEMCIEMNSKNCDYFLSNKTDKKLTILKSELDNIIDLENQKKMIQIYFKYILKGYIFDEEIYQYQFSKYMITYTLEEIKPFLILHFLSINDLITIITGYLENQVYDIKDICAFCKKGFNKVNKTSPHIKIKFDKIKKKYSLDFQNYESLDTENYEFHILHFECFDQNNITHIEYYECMSNYSDSDDYWSDNWSDY